MSSPINLSAAVHAALRGGPCEPFGQKMRVKVAETSLYTYPDLSIVCGESEFEDDHFDTLLNPLVLVEILSPSTEAYDRGQKFRQYRRIPSLRVYVLIEQERPAAEVFTKTDAGTWTLSEARGLDGSITLDPPGLTLRLSDLYERVVFPDDDLYRGGHNFEDGLP
jgi:Uma2 family endonuclease